MELRVLKYFLAVVQEENITKAAEILHITQPTLSRQLMELEEELNTTLFIRGKKNIILTEDGMLLRQRAMEIIELADKTKNDFMQQKNLISGTISIGCVESLSTRFLIEIIEKFSKEYSNVQFDFYNGYVDDIKERIDKGLIDIALLLEPAEISKYDYIRLPQEERWGILLKSDDSLAEKELITLEDIKGLPLILPKRVVVQNEVINWFGSKITNPHIFATYNLFSNAILLVEKGLGYAVCLDGALSIQNNNKTKFIPIEPKQITKGIFVWKKNQVFTSATKLFIDKIKNAF